MANVPKLFCYFNSKPYVAERFKIIVQTNRKTLMKKQLFALALGATMMTACQEDDVAKFDNTANDAIDMSDFSVRTDAETNGSRVAQGSKHCVSMAVLNRQLDENPGLYKKMYNIEKETRTILARQGSVNQKKGGGGKPGGGGGGGGTPVDDNLGTVNIPVYVHVIYSNNQENISDAQINSQMSVLNADFNKTNSDVNNVPSEFAGLVADADITFALAGVTRKSSSTASWGTNDAMKSASNGGVNVVSPSNALNIWICNIGGGILGYAQFPGGSSSTDGVVISPQYFGTTGFVSAPFNKGRTATHEVGHYLNLRHIWGDGRCKQDDFVSDTPSSDGPNYGCPSYPTVNCRNNDMTMNYMDYSDDACMYMFSNGQKDRMRAIFAAGGSRSAFAN
ncbi:MAG: hypothetical protein ACI85I_000379 [Arenicella sp.]